MWVAHPGGRFYYRSRIGFAKLVEMQRFRPLLLSTIFLSIALHAQQRARVEGDHSKVPPARVPSPYMSAADIQMALNKLDPKLVSVVSG